MGFQGLLNLSFCFLNWKWPWSLCCFRSTSIVCLEKSVFLFFFYCRLNTLKNPSCFLCFFQCRRCNNSFTYLFKNCLKRKRRAIASETLEAKREKYDSVYVWTRLLLSFASSGNLSCFSLCPQSNKQTASFWRHRNNFLVGDFHVYTYLTKLILP